MMELIELSNTHDFIIFKTDSKGIGQPYTIYKGNSYTIGYFLKCGEFEIHSVILNPNNDSIYVTFSVVEERKMK